MAKTKKDQRRILEDDDSNSNKHKKQPKHSANLKGRGMRVINKFVEEDIEDDDDYLDNESDNAFKMKHNVYTQTIR